MCQRRCLSRPTLLQTVEIQHHCHNGLIFECFTFQAKQNAHIHIPPAWAYRKSIPSGVSNWLMAVVDLRAQNGILAVQHPRNEVVWCVYCQSDPTFTSASHTLIFSLVAMTRNKFEIAVQWQIQMISCSTFFGSISGMGNLMSPGSRVSASKVC